MADYFTGNYRLNDEEMHTNALYFAGLLRDQGWMFESIAGLFGNAQSESRLNPGAWQDYSTAGADDDNKGFGFVQWTPARDFRKWCSAHSYSPDTFDTVIRRFNYEAEEGLQYYKTQKYPTPATFYDFMRSTQDPYYLAGAFLYNYERPQTPDPDRRGKQAEYWYAYITGNPLPKRKAKWMFYIRKKSIIF